MAPSDAPQKPRIALWRKLLPFVVAAVLLGFIARRIDWNAFVHALQTVNYTGLLSFAVAWQIALLAADALGNFAAYRLTLPFVRYRDFYVFRGASYLPGILNHHLGQAYLTYLMSKLAKIPLARVAGTTLVSYAGWFGCLLGCVAIALPWTELPLWPIPVILVAGLGYLGVLALRPKALENVAFLAPLFEAGVKGHAVALLARLPHLGVLVLGTWAGYFFFNVHLPVGTALVYLPIMLMITTLPITPQGFGAREAFAATFFVRYAPGATPEEQVGRLTAATTSWGVSVTLVGILIGLVCDRIVDRRLLAQAAEAQASESGAVGG